MSLVVKGSGKSFNHKSFAIRASRRVNHRLAHSGPLIRKMATAGPYQASVSPVVSAQALVSDARLSNFQKGVAFSLDSALINRSSQGVGALPNR